MPDEQNPNPENDKADHRIAGTSGFGAHIGKIQSAITTEQSGNPPRPPVLMFIIGPFVRDWKRARFHSLKASEWYPLLVALLAIGIAAFTARTLVKQLSEMQAQTTQIIAQRQTENSSASWEATKTFRQLNIAQQQANAASGALKQSIADSVENAKRVERQLRIWQEQTKASQLQAEYAGRSLIALQEQFKREQRPYVSITKFEIMDHVTGKRMESQEFQIGKPLYVNIDFKNIGRTAAINVIPHYHLLFGRDIALIRPEPADTAISGSTIDPDSVGAVTAVSLRDTYSRETVYVNQADLVSWDGSEPVIIFGRFMYRDLAGTEYCDPFLVQRIPGNWATLPKFGRLTPNDLCPKK